MILILMSGCQKETVEEIIVLDNHVEAVETVKTVKTVDNLVTLCAEPVEPVEVVHFDNEYDNLIYQACEGTVVDPYLAISISRLETGHYTSRAFVEGYNFGGITGNSGVKSFNSLNEGLEKYISLLEWYHAADMDTPEKMQPVYCPPNESWDEVVNSIYEARVS